MVEAVSFPRGWTAAVLRSSTSWTTGPCCCSPYNSVTPLSMLPENQKTALIPVWRSEYKECGNVSLLAWKGRRLFVLPGGPIGHGERELLKEFEWKGSTQTHSQGTIFKLRLLTESFTWLPFYSLLHSQTRKLLKTHFHTSKPHRSDWGWNALLKSTAESWASSFSHFFFFSFWKINLK